MVDSPGWTSEGSGWHVGKPLGSQNPALHGTTWLQVSLNRLGAHPALVPDGPYGPLYRPKYFAGDGVAIHGYSSVPATPASHGCVRVTNAAIDMLWSSGILPIGTAVWVY